LLRRIEKKVIVLVTAILLVLILTACSGEDVSAESSTVSTSEVPSQASSTQDAIEEGQATIAAMDAVTPSNNLSDAELEELIEITAAKVGRTGDQYKADCAAEGKTPLEEFQQAADFMGISLKEYYAAEKHTAANMSPGAKENQENMAAFFDAVGDIDVEGMEAEMDKVSEMSDEEAYAYVIASVAGEGADAFSGTKETEGGFKTFGQYDVVEVIESNHDIELGVFTIRYKSSASPSVLIEYYREKLSGTPGYTVNYIEDNPSADFMGTINGGDWVSLSVYPVDGSNESWVYYYIEDK